MPSNHAQSKKSLPTTLRAKVVVVGEAASGKSAILKQLVYKRQHTLIQHVLKQLDVCLGAHTTHTFTYYFEI